MKKISYLKAGELNTKQIRADGEVWAQVVHVEGMTEWGVEEVSWGSNREANNAQQRDQCTATQSSVWQSRAVCGKAEQCVTEQFEVK